jgi:hypothetical protein
LPITCDVHLLGAYGDADAHANHSGTSPASSSYKSFPGRLKHTELNLVVYCVSLDNISLDYNTHIISFSYIKALCAKESVACH